MITDENGDVIDVVKNAGESLVINMTIFLDLAVEDNTFLTLGDNNLIKLLLGENLVDKTIYAVRGTNMSDNISQARVYPRFDKKYKANISSILTDNGAELNIISKLGEGATREIVFIINNEVVARKNIMEFRPSISILNTVTSSNRGSAIVDENVSDVIFKDKGNVTQNKR